MNSTNALLLKNVAAALKAIALVAHSSAKLQPPLTVIGLSADDLEPFDALVSRFERAVEVALGRLTRSLCHFESGAPGDTLRDRLNLVHKLGLISGIDIWLEMREVRNKIAHEYLPEQIVIIYRDVLTKYAAELNGLAGALPAYLQRRGLSSP